MRRSPLVTLLLLVGFAVISVTVWNLSGCSKGGKGDKTDTGPEGSTLALSATPAQTQVFRSVELTAALRDAYNVAIADERVVFFLAKVDVPIAGAPVYGGPGSSFFARPPSMNPAASIRSTTSNRGELTFGAPSAGPARLADSGRSDPTGLSPKAVDQGRLESPVSAPPQPFMSTPIALGEADITLDDVPIGSAIGEAVTDSMGVASLKVTSETLKHYTIYASSTGLNSNNVVVVFISNPMYKCGLRLTADKTVAYADGTSEVTITGRLTYSEEPVIGETLTFSATTTAGGPSEDVQFSANSGITNTNGEVVVTIKTSETGTYNICVDTEYSCPSGSPVDNSDACKFIDYRKNICELELMVDPSSAQANGQDEIAAAAYVTLNGDPVGNEQVDFELTYDDVESGSQKVYFVETGERTASVYTDEYGWAPVKIRSYGYAGQCSVEAVRHDLCPGSNDLNDRGKDTRLMTFTSNECMFILVVDSASALSDGRPESQIQAAGTLTFNGQPVSGKRVVLRLLDEQDQPFIGGYFAPNGENTIALMTDENGAVSVKFGSEEPGECVLNGKADFECPGMDDDFLEHEVSVTFNKNQCELAVSAVPYVAGSQGEPVTVTGVLALNGSTVPAGYGITFTAVATNPLIGGASLVFDSTNADSAKVYTDANGQAQVVLRSDAYVGECMIEAKTDEPCPGSGDAEPVKGETHVTFKPNECRVVIESDKTIVKADNDDYATLTMGLNINGDHYIQSGIPIKVSADLLQARFMESFGQTVTVHTGSDGLATARLMSDGGVGECNIYATTETASSTFHCPGSNEPVVGSSALMFQSNVCLMTVTVPATANADGTEVTATATLTINGVSVGPGIAVKFSADLDGVVFSGAGQGSIKVYTNGDGVATAKFSSPKYAGRCLIQATTDTGNAATDYMCPGSIGYYPTDEAEIIFAENDCSLELTINPTIAKANGSEVTATATLTINGRAIPNEPILFTVDRDNVLFSKNHQNTVSEYTNANGQVSVLFYSEGTTGDCTVFAEAETYECPGADARPSASAKMEFEPLDYSIELTAVSEDPWSDDGGSAAADGLTRIHLRAILTDKNNHPLSGQSILFGCENGCIEQYGTPVMTDGQGMATTRMTTSVMLWDDPTAPDELVTIWADYLISGVAVHREAMSYRFRKIGIASVTASDYSILEDGTEETQISAVVKCSDGYPVEGLALEMVSQLGIFTSTGTEMITYATGPQGGMSAKLKGQCLHGVSAEAVRISQTYCDYGNRSGLTPPAIWETAHVTFEEGGVGCYMFEMSVNPADVCVRRDTDTEGNETVTDQCYSDVWFRLVRKSDGTGVPGKNVDVWIESFSNALYKAFFGTDQNSQRVTLTTDAEGYVHVTVDATGAGKALVRARTPEFGNVAANTLINFSRGFCTRISPTSAMINEGQSVTFTASGGCSGSYSWTFDEGSPNSGWTSEGQSIQVFWGTEGAYNVTVCDEYNDCASAVVVVKSTAEETTEEEGTRGGGTGFNRGASKPVPTPAPEKK